MSSMAGCVVSFTFCLFIYNLCMYWLQLADWQSYYYNDIKAGGSIEDIQNRIKGILLHAMSSESSNCHMFCPTGLESWCYHNKAIAMGKKPTMPKRHEPLPKEIGTALAPLFQRLSSPELLSRCLGDRTQNPNESVNAQIWRYCPKTTFLARTTVEMGAAMAVLNFNEGPLSSLKVMKACGLDVGQTALELSKESEKKSLTEAKKRSTPEAKSRRKRRKLFKTTQQESKEKKEGVSYATGSF